MTPLSFREATSRDVAAMAASRLADTTAGPADERMAASRRHNCAEELQYLYVAPTHRRLGVASELLRLLAGWFCDHDVRRVCVNVNTDSEGAEAFYRRHGAQALSQYWYVWEDIGGVLAGSGG